MVLSAPAPGLRPGVRSRSGTSVVVQHIDGLSTHSVRPPPEATRMAEQHSFILLGVSRQSRASERAMGRAVVACGPQTGPVGIA